MGQHAFDRNPQHREAYRIVGGDPLPRLFGVPERWNMPVVRHKAVLDEKANFPPVDHYVLTLHIGGARVRRIDDPAYSAVADIGTVSLQTPFSSGSFRSDGLVDYAHFYFRRSLLNEIGASLGREVELEDFFARPAGPLNAMGIDYFARAADPLDPPSLMEMDSRAYLIGLELMRTLNGMGQGTSLEKGTLRRRELQRVRDFMEAHLDEPVRLSDLAAVARLSPFHFLRVFRTAFGETPAVHLMRRRTERARDLIANSPLSLAEIAYRTGFSSQSHMTRRIKWMFGVTPRQLRRLK